MQLSCSWNPSWEQELPHPEVTCFSGKETKKTPETKPENICSTLKSSYSLQFLFPNLLNTLPGNFFKGRNYNLPILLAITLILPEFLAWLLGVLVTPSISSLLQPSLLIVISSINSQVKGHLIPLILM